MTRLLATTALGLALGLTPALAQQDSPADMNTNAPAAMPEQPADAPAMQMEPTGPSEMQQDRSSDAPMAIEPRRDKSAKADKRDGTTAGLQYLTEQQPNDWLASQLIGKSVVNAENESVGDINDLVTDSNGKIQAALIGVGGFLGIGEKDVAVSFEDLKLSRDENNNVVAMINTNKDSLAQAPDYKTLAEQETVQGSIEDDRERNTSGY